MSKWYAELLRDNGLEAPHPWTFVVEQELVDTPDQACKALRKFGGEGWLCVTDEVLPRISGADVSLDCIPLSAELHDRDRSLHLRQQGDRWLIVTLSREEGDEHLVFEDQLLQIGGGSLQYETAWRKDDTGRWRPWCSRFVGFGEE